jgi:hypothetical protein
MNAEALAHASKACRESADVLTKAADEADVFLHRCPDAGRGMRQVSDEMRTRAIGLKVAAVFLARCTQFQNLDEALTAVERGGHVYVVPFTAPVVVRDDEDAPAPPTLRERISRLLWWRAAAKAA